MAFNTTLKITDLTVHKDLQAPDRGDTSHVADLADAIKRGVKLPRPKVMEITEGEAIHYCPFDGHHTIEAYELTGATTVPVAVYKGTLDDARVEAAKANKEHLGLKRSHKTKRWAAMTLLKLHANWSNKKIAAEAGVSVSLVEAVRSEMPDAKAVTSRVGEDGKTRKAPEQKKTRTPSEALADKESASESDSSATEKPKAVKSFNWKEHDANFGWLKRGIDGLADLTGDKTTAKKAHAALAAYFKLIEKLKAKLEE